ncbi:efflux transporter, RND family, MFP subunit [Rhodobacter ferrooxidans]|uniref:Efflux transporter, RND family, MFP subunit n=1 Tax=Rhodobacter ferrooxidans TaxID=371731 RepID=C8S5L8_9RHOB|nr:efflux transporter, RND family, MFP subunit [Rhodobacter sp. SW2]
MSGGMHKQQGKTGLAPDRQKENRMKVIHQILMIAVIGAVAIPLSARFVPGTRPWLDQIGLLQPLATLGFVPAEEAAEPDGRGGGPGVPVVAGEVRHQVLRDVVAAIGSARGVQSVDLSFGVTGRLTALAVAPGQRVAAGEVIAELDAEAARLMVERARLVLEDAQKTLDRLDQLTQSGATTNLQRQDAELALRTADLALQSAERDLADHELTAPIAGYVGLIEPQVGDLVTPTTVITRIEDRSSLIVDFRVPERVAARVAPGDIVSAAPIATPGQAGEGRIIAVDNRVDETSRTLRVQATIGNADDSLRAGILGPARSQPHKAFTGNEHLARHHRLQTVEIGQPVRIGLIRPGEPEPLHLVAQSRILDQRRRLDPVAHQVRGKCFAGIGGITIGHHQLARPRQQTRPARGNQRVDVFQRRLPTPQPALRHRPFQPRAHSDRTAGAPAAKGIQPTHASQPLGGDHAHLPDDLAALGSRDVTVQHLDGPVDLGQAAVVHGLAVVAHAGHARRPLRGKRIAPRAEFCDCRHAVCLLF